MTGDREMRTTRGLNDTQLMLARDAGDERGGSAIDKYAPQSGLVGPELEDVAGLTFERLADPLERLEAHAFHLAGFEQRDILLGDADAVGKLLRAHLAARQHDIEIDNDRTGA